MPEFFGESPSRPVRSISSINETEGARCSRRGYLSQVMTQQAKVQAINALVEEQRAECFWSNRPDWHPKNDEERKRALMTIKRHGSAAAFRRAAELQACL